MRRQATVLGRTRAAAAAAGLGFALACITPGAPGDQLYRAGDLRGALDSWRAEDPEALAARIAEVERELDARADAYVASARALEAQGRLAESILDYRLALDLRPDDHEILDHVQGLARRAVAQRRALHDSYRQVRARGDLRAARDALQRLRDLDPFEPAYQSEERRLRADLAEEQRRRRERIRLEQAARVESLVEAGRAAFSEERVEEALDLWRRALLIDPENERVQAYIQRAEQQLETLERLRSGEQSGGTG